MSCLPCGFSFGWFFFFFFPPSRGLYKNILVWVWMRVLRQPRGWCEGSLVLAVPRCYGSCPMTQNLCTALLFLCDSLCMYILLMFPLTRPNVLGNKISEDVSMLKTHPKPQYCCASLVLSLFGRKDVVDEQGTWRAGILLKGEAALGLFRRSVCTLLCFCLCSSSGISGV